MVKTVKPDTIINTINKSISDNITNSIQSSQNSVYQAQIVNILCDVDAINIVENGINTCRSTLKDKGVSNDLINKYCKSILNCKGSNISLNSSLNVTNITSQTAVITQTVKDTIKSDITANKFYIFQWCCVCINCGFQDPNVCFINLFNF